MELNLLHCHFCSTRRWQDAGIYERDCASCRRLNLLVERTRDTKQWQETITRMGRYRATIPQKDIEPLARYLAGAAGATVRSATAELKTYATRQNPFGAARATLQSAVAYVADEDLHEVLVIDTESGKLPSQIPVGNAPHGITITPDGSRAYIANMGSHDVSVIDLEFNQVMCQLSFY